MEEFNKDLNNESENEVAEETVETIETIETVVADAPVEEDFDFAPAEVEKCCCQSETKSKKISITGIILYAFGALSIVFGIVNLITTLNTIKQMYGSLQPLDFYTTLNLVTPLMTSAMLGIVSIGIGRLLFMVKNK